MRTNTIVVTFEDSRQRKHSPLNRQAEKFAILMSAKISWKDGQGLKEINEGKNNN
jgi:hypothetical protein